MSGPARSWLEWIESENGKKCSDAASLGIPPEKAEYLKNRLWHAFTAGMLCQEATAPDARGRRTE